MNRPVFQPSVESRLIEQELLKMKVGETLTYERMAEITSRPIETIQTPMRSALRRVLRDHDMVFACIKMSGFKRLNDIEIVEEGSAYAASIRRKAQRSLERQLKADFKNLNREQQAQASAQTSIMGTIAMMTKTSSITKLAGKIGEGVRELPTNQTLALFMKGKDKT